MDAPTTARRGARRAPADGTLARAHLEGRPDAFTRLYERFFVRLVALCRQLVADAATAEDLAQDTLIRAFESLDGFDTDCPMWPWLKRIARNLAIDHTRKHSRCVPSGLLAEDEVSACPDAFDPGPPAVADFADDLAERWYVEAVLRTIPVRQAAALELCHVEGWAQPEAAEILGASGNAFKQLMFRARRSMAEEYECRSASPIARRGIRPGTGEFSPPNRGEKSPPLPAPHGPQIAFRRPDVTDKIVA